MIKWPMLFCISSPLICAPSLGTQTGIPVKDSVNATDSINFEVEIAVL